MHRKGLDHRLDAICLKALAKPIASRYARMEDFASDLASFLHADVPEPTPARVTPPASTEKKPGLFARWMTKKTVEPENLSQFTTKIESKKLGSVRVLRDRVRFTFVGHGEVAPPLIEGQDRLYLDVGEALRPAVIDHHQGRGSQSSAVASVIGHHEYVLQALKPWRTEDSPFTIVLHRDPDLDSIASTYVALSLLCDGQPPAGVRRLVEYVDSIDRGEPGMSLERPFSPYAAIMHVAHRFSQTTWNSRDEQWTELVLAGLKILDYSLNESIRKSKTLAEIDAFQCPGLFRNLDRAEVSSEIERYQAKLAKPETQARFVTLKLPREDGKTSVVEALLVRIVQDANDPDRCLFFKDWARTDRTRAPLAGGFVALSIIEPGPTEGTTRALLSTKPGSSVMLDGLANLLEDAETTKRREKFGVDDRLIDLKSGQNLEPRPGYKNANPWYDGRAHEFTIVDTPRGGSWLTAEAIEAIFLQFGGNEQNETRFL
jgi:hypothetical protein